MMNAIIILNRTVTLWEVHVIKKKVIVLILGIIALLAVRKYMFSPYKEISKYVTQNELLLQRECELYLDQKYVNKADTEIDVMGIYGGEHNIVQFFYSGKGIAPSGVYYGFYYSPDDIPVPYCNGNEELKMVSEDEWIWEEVGDNGGRIRKIRDNWYYYEAWF